MKFFVAINVSVDWCFQMLGPSHSQGHYNDEDVKTNSITYGAKQQLLRKRGTKEQVLLRERICDAYGRS